MHLASLPILGRLVLLLVFMKKILFFTLPLLLFAQPPTLNLIVDHYYSPYMGAEDLLTLSAGVQYAENWCIQKPNPPRRGWGPSLLRLAELVAIWEPYNYLTTATQHEIFGHGYRARSFHKGGVKVKKYKLGVPPPYGSGGGSTRYHINPRKMTPFQDSAITSAGVEATSILAIRLKLQWLQAGMVNATQTSLYEYSQQDLTTYILATKDQVPFFGTGESGNDVHHYVRILHESLPHGKLSVKKLKKLALINYADPFTYYSLYAWWLYLISGKQMPVPMINIGSCGYLPGLRIGLAPFGPEYYLENFLVEQKKPIYFYLRGGEYAGLRSYGLGIEHAYLWTIGGAPWGFRADAWLQPDVPYKASASNNLITFDTTHQKHYKSRFGGALSLIGRIKITQDSAIFFQIGGKTNGFLPGETLTPSLIARIGFSFF